MNGTRKPTQVEEDTIYDFENLNVDGNKIVTSLISTTLLDDLDRIFCSAFETMESRFGSQSQKHLDSMETYKTSVLKYLMDFHANSDSGTPEEKKAKEYLIAKATWVLSSLPVDGLPPLPFLSRSVISTLDNLFSTAPEAIKEVSVHIFNARASIRFALRVLFCIITFLFI
jgi:hypothetical protein